MTENLQDQLYQLENKQTNKQRNKQKVLNIVLILDERWRTGVLQHFF